MSDKLGDINIRGFAAGISILTGIAALTGVVIYALTPSDKQDPDNIQLAENIETAPSHILSQADPNRTYNLFYNQHVDRDLVPLNSEPLSLQGCFAQTLALIATGYKREIDTLCIESGNEPNRMYKITCNLNEAFIESAELCVVRDRSDNMPPTLYETPSADNN